MTQEESPDRTALHEAASFGLSMDVVDERIRAAVDVDALWWGRTPLFEAVMYREPEVALRLVAAGADPWRPQMNGWSPGRLNLAGPEPALFGPAPAGVHLTEQEQAAVSRAQRLIEVLPDLDLDGTSIACVADIDSAEAVRRLQGRPVEIADFDDWVLDAYDLMSEEEFERTLGVTDVPGGCVLTKWGWFTASTPGVMALLTAGTIGYGMYANPKSGEQGSRFRDGVMLGWDLSPGSGQASPDDSSDEILRTFLYYNNTAAYCCDSVALEPDGPRAFTGPPEVMIRIAPLELWPNQA